jgi:DNA helicase IV
VNLPSESALSREQKEVISAPSEGTILVVGPPGSGKTVVAIVRTRALAKQRQEVESVVYNNVLTSYTGNESTFHSWLANWWRRSTGTQMPLVAPDENGGFWRSPDYVRAAELATGTSREKIRERGHWQHLIIDEAQDFPPEAHSLLSTIQLRVFSNLSDDERPSICVLADENQRIGTQHSTLKEIREAHVLLTRDDEYRLTKNYRNTRQIAEFAAHFCVGLETGIPELPTSVGDRPKVFVAKLDDSVDRIVNYARAHPNEEIGVLVYYKKTAKRIYNKLRHRLEEDDTHVQTYLGGSPEHGDASKLKFDTPGVITVLCFASAKGLEFDTVFLPELQTVRLEGIERDHVRMNLYVMCSRARRQLWLTVDDSTGTHPIWRLLPPKNLYEVANS